VNLVGDQTFPAAYVGEDATYLYMRFRVDGDPMDAQRGFVRKSDCAMLTRSRRGSRLLREPHDPRRGAPDAPPERRQRTGTA